MRGYWKASLSPAYNFFFSIFLLVGYEGLLRLTGNPSGERNLVDIWLTRLLSWASPYEWVISLAIFLLGLAYVYGIRKENTPLTGWVLVVMLVEAAAWGFLLYRLLPILTQTFLPTSAQLNLLSANFWEATALCMGAGFYEELFFRVVLVEGLLLLFTGLQARKSSAFHYVAAWILSAIIFSLCHFIYEKPSQYAFFYRSLFGLFMSGLYILRGFGITAWAHALYDMGVLWWS
ncbi:MAG: CPBP family intramembrane glutamic endopeptidase [Bacteroidia bacterium]|nr:CPBP family intramembrane metalloprotease [Bacteroidia bacterium]MDW8134706.1 CPBP family intramembrane glutamic endopeptidase [Bacteroidia bacterium]